MNAIRQRALLLFQQDRFELAEKAWREVLSLEPGDAEGHASLALCLLERDAFPEAEAEARAAVGAAPDAGFTHFVLARVLHARHRLAEASTAATQAVMHDPEVADYRALQAAIQGGQAHWQESLAAADAGLALDAEHIGCANLRALALTQLDRKDEAEATIAGALQRAPENSLTHANQGWAALHRGQPREAFPHFREALRLDPNNDWARQGLLTAIKARNPVFRWMLAFFLFMGRQTTAARWMIVLGIFVGQNIARTIALEYPQYGAVMWPIVIAFIAFVYLTWLANPLMNLVVRLHPMGKHALTDDQRRQSLLIGLVMAVAVLNLGAMVLNGGVNSYAMVPFALAIPVATIHGMKRGWPRALAGAIAGLFALAALELMVTNHYFQFLMVHVTLQRTATATLLVPLLGKVAGLLISPYFFAILAWSFISPLLARVLPTR